jgi:blue light- and temperature-responsive anti-repressor
LEGPQDAVEATFECIQTDLRHGAVTVLSFLPVERRSLPAWSMAFAGEPAPGATYALERVIPRLSDAEALTAAGSEVLRLQEGVVRNEDDQISL